MSGVCYNLTDRKQTDARLQQKSRSNKPKVNKHVFLSLFFQCFYCQFVLIWHLNETALVKRFRGTWMDAEEFTQRYHLTQADSDFRLVMSNSAYWIAFAVFGSCSCTGLLQWTWLQSAGRVTPSSALVFPCISLCSNLSLSLLLMFHHIICQLLLLTHTYEPNSDCSLKSNTAFQMHVYRAVYF